MPQPNQANNHIDARTECQVLILAAAVVVVAVEEETAEVQVELEQLDYLPSLLKFAPPLPLRHVCHIRAASYAYEALNSFYRV